MILGIDPGLSGALCWFDPATGDLDIHDVPTFTRKHGKRSRRYIDPYALAVLIDSRAARTSQAIIEQVSSMPGQGVASSFTFGYVFGLMEMSVCANLIPLTKVTPAQWKRAMKLGRDKSEARAHAASLSPRHHELWSRVKDDGRAEAFLLTQYWMRTQQNGQDADPGDGRKLDFGRAG